MSTDMVDTRLRPLLCVLCVSVVQSGGGRLTTETQRTQRRAKILLALFVAIRRMPLRRFDTRNLMDPRDPTFALLLKHRGEAIVIVERLALISTGLMCPPNDDGDVAAQKRNA